MTLFEQFQQFVNEYMDRFPEKFDIVFEEFEEEGIDIESLWQDNKAIFRANIKEFNDNALWLSKMAVLLFVDEYFLGHKEFLDDKTNLLYQSIAFLID